jgi:gamma-glutamylcyclotransferase
MDIYYFAYGSNLHPARLQARVPSAEFVEVAVLPDRALRFCKRSVDGSAKCTVVPALGSRTLGAVYRLPVEEKELLDRVEGLDQGYDEEWQGLPLSDGVVRTFYYVAMPGYLDATLQPYHWYKRLVLAGARYHGFSDAYLAAIDAVASLEDPDEDRRSRNERIVHACR